MQGGAGAPSMSGTPYRRRLFPKIGDVGCGRKRPHGSYSSLCSLPYSRSWGRAGHSDTQGVLCFGARGGNSHMGLILCKTTGICPFTGDSNPCQPRKWYTHGSTAGPLHPGALQVTLPHDPAGGEVCYEYQSWVVMQASLQLALFEPSKPSDSPPSIQELWVDTMLSQLLMSDTTLLLIPWRRMMCLIVHLGWNGMSSPTAF